jgi:predicted permease
MGGEGPSRLSAGILRTVMSDARAEAVLGDIGEELARRQAGGAPPRWPRLWVERQVWRYAMAAFRSAAPRLGRSLFYAFRDAWRAFRCAPASTGFILLILTAGIAASTVTFSVVDAVVLRHLPFEDDDRLVVVSADTPQVRSLTISAPEFLAWRDRTTVFENLAAVHSSGRVQVGDGDDEPPQAARVTASLFDVLRVRPILGRTFTAEHEIAGRDRVAVISHRLWQQRLGGDVSVIGSTIRIAQRNDVMPLVILAVMPEGFTYPAGREPTVDIWTPYVVPDDERWGETGGLDRYLHVVGRLREEATVAHAQADVEAAAAPLVEARPDGYRDWRPRVEGLLHSLVGSVRGWMLLVLWAVGLLLLVACVNAANLLLARATHRARDLAVRASLGAGRRQLLVALLAESLILTLVAGGAGILVAYWGIGAAKALLPAGIPRAADIGLDPRVLTTAIGTALATGLLFGTVPAWRASRTDVAPLLKDGGATPASRHWRSAFLVAEVAFVGVLLVATTLFVTSFVRVTTADLGFDRSGLLAVTISSGAGVDVPAAAEAVRHVPGILSVATFAASSPPLIAAAFGGGSAWMPLRPVDAVEAQPVPVDVKAVSAEYFDTLGLAFKRGRAFGLGAADGPQPIVIDELAARRLFGDRHAVGALVVNRTGRPEYTVVGVVANVLGRGPEGESGPQAYVRYVPGGGGSPQMLIRAVGDSVPLVPAVRAALGRSLPEGRRFDVRRMEDAFRVITAQRRFNASLMSVFGGFALFIGMAGIYGVMASVVAQRTREIGVRVALGATPGRIAREVLGQAARHLAIGLALGLPVALATSQVFSVLLFEVRPTNAVVYLIVVATLLGAGLAAAWLPARRAARIDPVVALRAE